MSSLKDKKSFKIELAVALIPAGVATGPAEAVIGRIVDIGSDGAPIVDFPKTRQAQTIVGYSNSEPGKSGQFTRTSRARGAPSRPGDLDGENVAVVRPADEVVADHATPFGSSPPMRPISRKFQRTTRLKDCSQSRCNSGRTRQEPRQTPTGRANCRRPRCERLRCNIGSRRLCDLR